MNSGVLVRWARRLPRWLIAVSGVSGLFMADGARATVFAPEAFDVTLLRADAVLVATVGNFVDASDDAGATDLVLTDHVVLKNRWGDRDAVGRIRIASREKDGELALNDHGNQYSFRKGGRYLLFLQGGAWTTGPFLSASMPVLEIADGVVRCPGGEIYGIGANGLVCSLANQEAGPPLNEAEAVDVVSKALSRAATRRPSVAQKYEAEKKPLELTRFRKTPGPAFRP